MPRLEQRHTDLAQGLSTVLDREADDYRVGVAGGKGPLRWVAEDAIAAEGREETSSSPRTANCGLRIILILEELTSEYNPLGE